MIAHEIKAPLDATLTKAVCDSWKERGTHRDPSDERQDRLVLHADNAVPFEQVQRASQWVQGCTRARQEAAPDDVMPAFWFQLSML